MNYQFLKHPGYENSNAAISTYFSSSTAEFIRAKIFELSRSFYPAGVYVPIERVIDVMNAVYEAYRPPTGDIYSRYIVPNDENSNSVDALINQTISVIFSQVRDQLQTDGVNSQLSVWSTQYGTFNENGLRAHPPITTRLKRPRPAMFNMNY